MITQPDFIEFDEILKIHEDQIRRYGGGAGIRDPNALVSAIEQPRATYGGEFLHPDLWSMGSAYIFHISENHPFLDGNKRTALVSGLIFLYINGIVIIDKNELLYPMMISVASGKSSKTEIANVLRNLEILA